METLLQWWPVFLAFTLNLTAFVAFLVRLDNKVTADKNDLLSKIERNKEEIKRVEEYFIKQRQEDMQERQHQFDKLDKRLDTIQSDIKILIKDSSIAHRQDR